MQVTMRPQFSSVMSSQPRSVQPMPSAPVSFSGRGFARPGLLSALFLALVSVVSSGCHSTIDHGQPEINRYNALTQALNSVTLTQDTSAQEKILTEVLSVKPGEACEVKSTYYGMLGSSEYKEDAAQVLKSRAVGYIPQLADPEAQVRLVTLALEDESLHDKLISVGNRKNKPALTLAAKELIFKAVNL